MSLTYNKNKSGPNIDPWGTPQERFPRSKNFLSVLTLKVLPDKYDSNHEIVFFRKYNASHQVFHDLVYQKKERVSIKPVYFPDSKPLFILSVNNVKQEFVEKDFRNLE